MPPLLRRLSALDAKLSARLCLSEQQRQWRHPLFWLAHVGAHLGDSVLWALVSVLLWRRAGDDPQRQRTLIGWVLSFTGGLVGTLLIKRLIRRPRPGGGRFLYGPGADLHSFPSGHGARSGVILAWADRLQAGSGPFAPLLVLWIGWSRVALGIHYIGDVLVGFVLGLGLARLFRRIFHQQK